MTPERQEQINQIFEKALELEGPEREAYLAKACGGDNGLRVEVERLIAADQKNMEDPLDSEQLIHESQLSKRYELIRVLGQGGYGRVYLAQDNNIERPVAIKFLSVRPDLGKEQVSRFRQEAQAAWDINHPNVVRIIDLQSDGPRPYIVSEYVDGETLRERLQQGPMPASEALRIATGVAAALQAAHAKGVIHRDINPANVMISRVDDKVKVLDFGISKFTRRDEEIDPNATTRHLTAPATVFGTFDYMSPEQLGGIQVDGRTDLWSLGVVLYEMLTGQPPFEGKTQGEQVYRMTKGPPSLQSINPTIHSEVAAIVYRALAPEIDDRYQKAEEFEADLERVLERIQSEKVSAAHEDDVLVGSQLSTADVSSVSEQRASDVRVSNQHNAFISHNKLDEVFALKLKRALASRCVNAWSFEEDINAGMKWRKAVEQALINASHLIIVVSQNSVDSDSVHEEVGIFKEKGDQAPIIPVLIDDAEIPLSWRQTQWVDFRPPKDSSLSPDWYSLALDKLLTAFGEEPLPALRLRPLGEGGPPVALTAFPADAIDSSSAIPFDIGTCWGLDRGTYIGILAGSPSHDLYEALQRVERALLEASKQEEAQAVSQRWWLKIDPFAAPNGPESKPDVWNSVVDRPNNQFQLLVTERLPDSVTPGFVIEVDDDRLEDDSGQLIIAWAEALVNRAFSNTEIAIVFNLLTRSPSDMRAASEKLVERIRFVAGEIPIYQACIRNPSQERTVPIPGDESRLENQSALDAVRASLKAPTGAHFYAWLNAMASASQTQFGGALKRYAKVKELLDSLPDSISNHINRTDAASVVADVDAQAHLPNGFDGEFLLLTRDFWPHRFAELLRAYSGSSRKRARRTAQVIAGREDLLPEFWDSTDEENKLDANSEYDGSFLDRWVEGQLRKYWSERSETTKAQLEKYVDSLSLSTPLRAVTSLFLGKIDVGQFLRDNGRDAYFAAFNAGYDFDFSLRDAGETQVDNADLWLLISALPTNKQRLTQVLKMDQSQRAIFGLITTGEWNSIKNDRILVQKLLIIRDSRPLHFRS